MTLMNVAESPAVWCTSDHVISQRCYISVGSVVSMSRCVSQLLCSSRHLQSVLHQLSRKCWPPIQ
uniref:Uncharacterized protein n=1 Tax=Anguilla anguilla TaxID=7936 RepID=A0A0E9XSH2_ANGAN